MRAYVKNVIDCKSEYEDEFLYACEVDREVTMKNIFIAMDYSNKHWVGKDKGKSGLRRWAENGAGLKIVNMSQFPQDGEFSFDAKIYKPLGIRVYVNDELVFDKYFTNFSQKAKISADVENILPGENEVTIGVYAADGSEILSDKKKDVPAIYDVKIE